MADIKVAYDSAVAEAGSDVVVKLSEAKQHDQSENELNAKRSALDEALGLQSDAIQKVADAEKALADARVKPGSLERLTGCLRIL